MTRYIILILLTLFITMSYSQNVILGHQDNTPLSEVESYPQRTIIKPDSKWRVSFDNEETWTEYSFPFLLNEEDRVVLKSTFVINSEKKSNLYFLIIRGLTGLKELFINENKINLDAFDLEQFKIPVQGKLVKENAQNTIKLVLSSGFHFQKEHLSSNLLRSKKAIGIYDDIFLMSSTRTIINNIKLKTIPFNTANSFSMSFVCDIINTDSKISNQLNDYTIKISILNKQTRTQIHSFQQSFQIRSGANLSLTFNSTINGVELWSPLSPLLYEFNVSILENESLIDEYIFDYGFKSVGFKDNSFILNGKEIPLNGVTYFENNGIFNSIFTHNEIKRDIGLIKSIGANSIRIINSLPSKKLIDECDEQGLMVFIELDDRYYTKEYLNEYNFLDHQKNKLGKILEYFGTNVSFSAVSLGKLNDIETETYFISLHKALEKENPTILSFANIEKVLPFSALTCDFFGVEIFNTDTNKINRTLSELRANKMNYVISALGYIHNYGINDGYEDKYSMQAQAKYFSEIIEMISQYNIPYMVHSFADYRTTYHSILSGKTDSELLCFGLVNEFRDQKKNSFYTLKSYFSDEKLPVITQGNYSDKKNIIFIIAGVVSVFLFTLLINSTRRFREYSLRALTRTYNFFSDVRDQRIFSISQTSLLALIISATISILYTSMLIYYKDLFIFEKFVSVFNSELLFDIISYLAWRPIEALIIVTLICFLVFLLGSIIIKLFNMTVRTKIYFSHAYIVMIWSFLPFILSVPLGIIFFKLLTYGEYNLFLILAVILFHLWSVSRLLKGISIIFDVRIMRVYLFAFIFVLVLFSGIILYYQTTNSTYDYFIYFLTQV